ncbi:MAG: hypothetical protein HC866_04015 [Leptolyngbyaceae cyanobacterium RU_5_1]|nr:hypothetical protein [Leptolyngbyaceae cyanobacterium RU_5_1]
MKKASTFFANSKGDLHTSSKAYVYAVKQRLFETPERALNRAYSAALLIQSLERESLQRRRAASPVNHNRAIEISLQANLKQLLGLIKLRLREFRFSHLVLGYQNSNYRERMELIEQHVEKLKLIDEVLDRYTPKQNFSSILSLFQQQKTHSNTIADMNI